jgi:putative NADH-flavin reductase
MLTELQEHGHEVTALVRDDAQADRVAALGATPAVVDLYDRPAVTSRELPKEWRLTDPRWPEDAAN